MPIKKAAENGYLDFLNYVSSRPDVSESDIVTGCCKCVIIRSTPYKGNLSSFSNRFSKI